LTARAHTASPQSEPPQRIIGRHQRHHSPQARRRFTLSSVYADDQGNALRSRTQVLRSIKKTEIRLSQARWLTPAPLDDRNHPHSSA